MAGHRTYDHQYYRRIGQLHYWNHCPLTKRTLREAYKSETSLSTLLVESGSKKTGGSWSYCLPSSVQHCLSCGTTTGANNDRTISLFAVWSIRYITSLRSNRLEGVSMLLSFQASHVLLSTLLTEGLGCAFRIFVCAREQSARKRQKGLQRVYSEEKVMHHAARREMKGGKARTVWTMISSTVSWLLGQSRWSRDRHLHQRSNKLVIKLSSRSSSCTSYVAEVMV